MALAIVASILLFSASFADYSLSSHDTEISSLGIGRSSDAVISSLAERGTIKFEKVVAATWTAQRSGLINLDNPKAKAIGLKDGKEPIEIYFFVIEHPDFGTFVIDTGVAEVFRRRGEKTGVGSVVATALGVNSINVQISMRDWLAARSDPLRGVFLTHLHFDHIMGMPDLANDTVLYAGPGETQAKGIINIVLRETIDNMLRGKEPIREWQFEDDPASRFAGVVDVFGDGSLWALHVPGHSPGSTAFLVRATDGVKLVLGDAAHTRWGWEKGVESGTFSDNIRASAESLSALKQFVFDYPKIEVHAGHQ